MRAFFEAEWAAASPRGRASLLLRTLVATPRHGLRERWTERRSLGGGGEMGRVWKEFVLAIRGLTRRPGFALATIGTVALGIGAATTVFTVVDHVVLRPLPYDDPDELVSMWTTFDNYEDGSFGMSLAVQHDYAQQTRVIEAMGGFGRSESIWTGMGDATRVGVFWLRGEPFRVTGIRAAMGRLPDLEDQESGAPAVAVVTDEFWRSSLAADPEVLGRVLQLDGSGVEIIGVLEPGARLPGAEAGIWRPQARSRVDIQDRSGHWMDVLARLRPGESLASLQAEIEQVHEQWSVTFAGEHSPGHSGHYIRAGEAQEWYFGDLRETGRLLLSAVGLLLLLACANVAALLLARGEGRMGEFAVRRALGAGRATVARALLSESLVIALLGGAAGVVLSIVGVQAVLAAAPPELPRLSAVAVDGRILVFALVVSIASGVLFGTLPAFRGGNARPGTRGEAGIGRGLSRSLAGLVLVQLGLAVLLVSGAGVLTRSVQRMLDHDSGVQMAGRLTAAVSVPRATYLDREAVLGFWERADAAIEAIPGVERASFTRSLPMVGTLRNEMVRNVGPGVDAARNDGHSMGAQSVAHDWFEVAGIPVVEGRSFDATDREGTEFVAILNREAARRYFPQGSAVGRQIQPLWIPPEVGMATIVGVVDDVTHDGVRSAVQPELYLAMEQAAWNEVPSLRNVSLVVRASGDPAAVAQPIRNAIRELDPAVPVENVATWESAAASGLVSERFVATLVRVFALLALLLAGLGTYGLVSFTTARRTREVGVRIALGARPGLVAARVVRRTSTLAIVGIGLGAALAALAAPLLESFVYGVDARDPISLGMASATLIVVTVAAALAPALRASAVDPARALRDES